MSVAGVADRRERRRLADREAERAHKEIYDAPERKDNNEADKFRS